MEKNWSNTAAASTAFRSEIMHFLRKRMRQMPASEDVQEGFKMQLAKVLKTLLTKFKDADWQTTEMKATWESEIAWINRLVFQTIFERAGLAWNLD